MAYDRESHSYSPDPVALPDYEPGMFYLGLSPVDGKPKGYRAEKHGITVAGNQTGKGSTFIIPNICRWQGNVVCIDPKGGNVEATWRIREAMGQRVCVLDPLQIADIPDRLRASYNIFDELDPKALDINGQLRALAQGMVIRTDPRALHWDLNAETVIAGLASHNLVNAPKGKRSLIQIRKFLRQPQAQRTEAFHVMAETGTPLARSAAAAMLGSDSESQHFLSAINTSTGWLDDQPFEKLLSKSTFKMSELRTGKIDIFLVLPPNRITTYNRFLRLFVRMALDSMGVTPRGLKAENGKRRRTLFVLDEFFQLGTMEEIQNAAGVLLEAGVHLWPIVQDLGQLKHLYKDVHQTFFANADVQQFFGLNDQETEEFVSRRVGDITHTDLNIRPSILANNGKGPVPVHISDPPLQQTPPIPWHVMEQAVSTPSPPMMIPYDMKAKGGAGLFIPLIANSVASASYQARMQAKQAADHQIRLIQDATMRDYQNALIVHNERKALAEAEYRARKLEFDYYERLSKEAHENEKTLVSFAQSMVGKRRLTPERVRQLVRKTEHGGVAQASIIFTPEGWSVMTPQGYWEDDWYTGYFPRIEEARREKQRKPYRDMLEAALADLGEHRDAWKWRKRADVLEALDEAAQGDKGRLRVVLSAIKDDIAWWDDYEQHSKESVARIAAEFGPKLADWVNPEEEAERQALAAAERQRLIENLDSDETTIRFLPKDGTKFDRRAARLMVEACAADPGMVRKGVKLQGSPDQQALMRAVIEEVNAGLPEAERLRISEPFFAKVRKWLSV